MRSLLAATGIVVVAAYAQAQAASAAKPASAPAAKTSAPAAKTTAEDTEAPALIKSVADDPNDSPMVRAAKRAVASRKPNQRRVVSLNSSSSTTKGRVAFSTGPAEGPRLPPLPSDAKPLQPSAQDAAAAAAQKAQVQEKLKRLEQEERMLAAETDEPYGGDIEEDQVEQRLSQIEAERKKLQETPPPPPPS